MIQKKKNNIPPQSFTTYANGIARALISDVKISHAFDPTKQTPPPMRLYKGIWDTGATGSVITKRVASECGLKPISMIKAYGVNGEYNAPVYLINMFLRNNVGIPKVRVTEGDINGVDVLIGMDIISMGDFAVTNYQGKTIFSFRVPSTHQIDFVKESKINIKNSDLATKLFGGPQVGKNAKCPCGSGKKYKKCCMAKDKALKNSNSEIQLPNDR